MQLQRLQIRCDIFLLARLLACLLVIRQHIEFDYPTLNIFNKNIGWILGGTNESGSQAIVFFFFLSAYLMSKICLSGKYQLNWSGIKQFWFNRLKRIVPLYYFVCVVSLIVAWRYILEPASYNIGRLLLIFGFGYSGSFPFNQVIWTIGIELLFYLLCPLLFLIYARISDSKALCYSMFGLSLSSFWWWKGSQLLPYSSISTFNSFLDYIPVFWLGSSCFLIVKHLPRLQSKYNLATIATLLLIISLMIPTKYLTLTGVSYQLVISLISCFFVVTKETFDSQYNNNRNWLNHLGMLTFGIYLWHIVVLNIVGGLYRSWLITKLGNPTLVGYILWIIVSIISIILANWSYYNIELPASKWLDKYYGKKGYYTT